MSDVAITFVVLGVVVALFVWNRLPVEVVAVGSALALYASGVLGVEQALAGFGDQTVIFIAALFVVSGSLDAAGVTQWTGQQLIRRAGGTRSGLLVATMLLVALLTALITVNGAVAALVPVIVVAAIKLGRSPSQMLLPLAFGAHAGSLLVLTGTPVNVIVSDAAADAGVGQFGFFEFALVGVPLVAGAIAIVVLFGERLLPTRSSGSSFPDLGGHARVLGEEYALEADPEELVTPEQGVAEVMVPPRSELVGQRVFPGMTTSSGDFVVLAVQRKGEVTGPGETELAAGDTLLLHGSWDAMERKAGSPEVLFVESPGLLRQQARGLGPKARPALAGLVLTVVLLASGVVPPAVAALIGAGAMLLLGVVKVEEAYRSISWTTVVLVAAMIPLSTAIRVTGAGEEMAELLVGIVGDAGPRALLLGLFVLTVALGQVISNTATALIVIPIAVSAAAEVDVSPEPVLMAVAVAAAASFLTPIATPANLMVMGPGGYRFGDYWKLGLPMVVLFLLVATLLVPVFWSF